MRFNLPLLLVANLVALTVLSPVNAAVEPSLFVPAAESAGGPTPGPAGIPEELLPLVRRAPVKDPALPSFEANHTLLPDLGPPLFEEHPDDCGTGRDAGGSSSPEPLSPPVECEGRLQGGEYEDSYAFTAAPGQFVKVEATGGAGSSSSVDVCLQGPDGSYVACRYVRAGDTARLGEATTEGGTYQLSFRGFYAEYAMRIVVEDWVTLSDCGSGDDSGGDFTSALDVPFPGTCRGSLNPVDDLEDWYSFVLPSGSAAHVSLRPNAFSDFDLCVYALTDGPRLLDCSVRSADQVDASFVHVPSGGVVLVRVRHFSGAEDYVLTVDRAAPQDDCGTGGDAGSAYRTELVGSLPVTCSGAVEPNLGDLWDLYSVVVREEGIRLSLMPLSGDVMVCLYPPGEYYPVRCSFEDGEDRLERIEYVTAIPGTWLVGVIGYPQGGRYLLHVDEFTPSPQDDCGSGRDAGELRGQDIALPGAGSCSGRLVGDDGDWVDEYTFRAPPSHVSVDFTSGSEEALEVCVYPVRRPFWCSERVEPGASTNIPGLAREEGDWRIEVRRLGSLGGSYDFTVSFQPAPDDCGVGGDAGDGPSEASRLGEPRLMCDARLYPYSGDRGDWYSVHLESGDALTVVASTEDRDGWLVVCLFSPSGGVESCSFSVRPGGPLDLGEWSMVQAVAEESGDHLVAVFGSFRAMIPYRLSVAAA